jgi:hypothetical protein
VSTVIVQDDGTQVEIKPEFADKARAAGHHVVDTMEGADTPDKYATLRNAIYGGAGGLGAAGAVIGGAKIVGGVRKLGGSAAEPLARAAGKFAAKQIPGVATAIDLYDAAKSVQGGGAPPASTAAAPAPGSPEASILEQKAIKMAHDARAAGARADMAEHRLAKLTESVSTPAPEGKVVGSITPKVRLGQKATPTQRGASQRTLAQRAKGLAEAGAPAAPPAELAAGEPDLAAQMRRTFALEKIMDARGIPQAERAGLRAGVAMAERGALGPALKGVAHLGGPAVDLLLAILNSRDLPAQMAEADRTYDAIPAVARARAPLKKALARAPQSL